MSLVRFVLLISVLLFSSCMQEQVKLEGSFDLEGFDFDVEPPKVRLAASTSPYEKSNAPTLRVITGPDILDCASFTRFAVSETTTRPSLSQFKYTCTQAGSQIITYNLSDTTEGNRKLYFWGYSDSSQKYSTYSSLDFIYDETAPTGTLGTIPSLVRGGTTQALALTNSDNILFDTYKVEFTANGSTWTEIGTFNKDTTSADLDLPLADSSISQVKVTLKDKAANTAVITSSNFTIDSTAPTLSITNLPANVAGGSSQSISFTTYDLNGVNTWELQYSSDGGSNYTTIATDPTSPYTWTAPMGETANGLIRLNAVDNAGNPDNTSTATFIIDSTPPSVAINTISSPLRGGSTYTLNYTVTDASAINSITLEYAADGTTYSPLATVTGTSSYSWSVPSDNTTASRIRITAVDAAGNSNSAISNAFIVDSTAPTASLANVSTSPLRGGNTEAVTFTYSDTNGIASVALNFASDGVTFSNVVNNPTSPYTWTIPSLNTSGNKLQLVVVDNAGNSTTVTNSAFIIDSIAPTLSLTDPSSLLKGGATEAVTFSSSDANGVASTSLQYAANGTTFTEIVANPTSPYTWTIPTDDTTTAKLRFVVTDNAGNVSQTESSAFTIDSTVPTLAITDLPAVVRGGTSQSVTFTATDSSGFSNLIVEYAADGTTFTTLVPHQASSPYSWTLPSVDTTGSRLRLSATDNAGNSNSVTTAAFNIDSTAPAITLADLAAVIRGGQNSSVSFTATDANGLGTTTLNYAADGTTFSTTLATNPTSPYTWAVPSVDTTGSKLQLVVSDSVGNTSTVTNAAFNIDSTPPSLAITNLPTPLRGGNSQNITFTNSDANGVASLLLEYSLDGINYVTISASPTSPQSWTIPSSDTVNADIRLTGTDSVGNSISVKSNTFTIDSTPPTVDITDLAAVVRGGATQSVTFTASDSTGIANIQLLYAANGTTFSQIQASATSPYSWTIPTVDTSASALRVIATDNAGNTASHTTTTFAIDSTPPSLTLANMAAVIRGGINNNVTHTKSDTNGIASTQLLYAADGVNFTSVVNNPATTYAWATPSVDLATAKLRFTATDVAGNTQTVTNNVFEIDSTPPTGSISTPPSPILGGSNHNIVFSTADSNGIGSIAIQYAADGTNFSSTLTTTNSSPFTWTLPSTTTSGSRIRLVTTDSVGNQAIYTSGAFNIDSTPPATPSLALTSAVYTNSTSNTFTASSCGDVSAIFINEGTQPTKDAAGWQSCTTAANAITYSIAATEGPHTLKAWSKDSVGNVSTTSSNFTVYYDVTNPVISVSNPGLMRGGATYTLNWTLTEQYINNTRNFTVQYWNGSAWNSVGTVAATTGPHTAQGYSTSWTAASLNRTDVRIRVSVTDLAGNSVTSQSTTFEIDSIAPALTIASPAASSYHKSSVVITGNCETGRNIDFSGDLQASFSVLCSGGTYSQTVNFSDNDGTKTINVAQTDAAGNTTSLSRAFIRDEVAPILTLSSGNNPDFTNQNTPNAWGGTCEGNYTITITGDQSTSISCSAGTWSWTPAPKTTDGTFSYSLVQTDAAGNTSTPPLSVSWERDATPPLFNMSSPISISGGGSGTDTNNLNQRTLSGSCEGSNTINITGTQTTAISCSASSWSWTTATYTSDGTRAYTLSQSDSAGNTTTLNYTWVRDTTGPGLTITDNSLKTNTNTATFGGNCETGINVEVSGAQTASVTCPSGTWSWTTASNATDATRNYTFTQTFTVSPFNSTSVSGSWIRETNIPTISQFTTTATNPSKNAYIPINLQATSQNANVAISHVCFTRLTTTAPTANDPCWVGVDSPSVGLPLGQTLTLSDFSMLLGWETQSYDVYAWVKDEAENINSLTNAGSGTVGTDKIVHNYDPGIAPTLSDVVAANVNNSQIPPTRAESSVPAGQNVYIRWKVTDNVALPAGAISLFYTTDDINYTAISTAQSLDAHANTGCGAMTLDTNEGCYLWPGGSPLNTPYKILVKATDASSITTQAASNNTNTDILKVLAGNTEKGVGGSAQTAVFINEGTGDSVDPNTLVYTADGKLYFADYDRGILTVDPDTGKLVVFIARTGTSSGDGGAAANATLIRAIKITLDYQGRLLIFDNNRIRRVDLNQETPTIETIIGDGSDKGDTVANALNVDIDDMCDGCNEEDAMPFFAMPNGDIVFFSERPIKYQNNATMPRLRIYKQATGQVISKHYSGVGDSNIPTQDLTKCRLSHFGVSFDSNSEFVHNIAFVEKNTAWAGCDDQDGWRKAYFDPDTFATITAVNDANRWWNRYHYTGMDGKLYKLGYGGRVDVVNADGSETLVLGTGTRGECPDGTAATSCNINFRTFFVNTNGEMFFVDSGAIRVVDGSGNVKTILGQRKTYGDGVLAINGRFEVVREVTRRDNGDIVVLDSDGYYIKEFTPEGNINVVAGNGNLIQPDLGQPAKYNASYVRSYVQVDKTNGDIYMSRSSHYGHILKLNRSTGLYEEVIGNSAGTNYETADGTVGLSVDQGGDANRALPIGINDDHLIMLRMKYNGTASRYGTFRLKAYDRADSFRQSHLMGVNGLEYPADGNVRKICDAATPGPTTASTCDAPYWDTFSNADWDATNNRWILGISIGGTQQNVFALDPATDSIEQIAYVGGDIGEWYKFVHHSNGSEALYYCSGGRIRKYNLDTPADEGVMTWPIANMYCRGNRADYNPTNNSIIFPFEQNGLYGVAEYFLP